MILTQIEMKINIKIKIYFKISKIELGIDLINKKSTRGDWYFLV